MFEAVKRILSAKVAVDETAEAWAHQNTHTPDISALEQAKFKPLFVSDDMKKGGRLHHLLSPETAYKGKPFHPTCYTHDKFTFWEKDLGELSYPVTLPHDYQPTGHIIGRGSLEPARIKGELWLIRPPRFILLDKERENGVKFHRIETRIILPYREVRHNPTSTHISEDRIHTHICMMYVGDVDYWDPQIGGIFTSGQMETYEHDVKKIWIDKYYKWPG